MTKLYVISPNIIRSKEFRKHLHISTNDANPSGSEEEAFQVAKTAIENPDDHVWKSFGDDVVLISSKPDVEHSDDSNTLNALPRDQLEVKAKLFLKEFSFEAAEEALERVFREIDSDYVDSLQLAVPYAGLTHLAIGEQERPKTPENAADLDNLEAFVKSGAVHSMGLCDIEADALSEIYEKAEEKPKSITAFAESRGMRLLTHNDPLTILKEKRLKAIKGNEYTILDWVIRFQVMDKARGVLRDKRYILAFRESLP